MIITMLCVWTSGHVVTQYTIQNPGHMTIHVNCCVIRTDVYIPYITFFLLIQMFSQILTKDSTTRYHGTPVRTNNIFSIDMDEQCSGEGYGLLILGSSIVISKRASICLYHQYFSDLDEIRYVCYRLIRFLPF